MTVDKQAPVGYIPVQAAGIPVPVEKPLLIPGVAVPVQGAGIPVSEVRIPVSEA